MRRATCIPRRRRFGSCCPACETKTAAPSNAARKALRKVCIPLGRRGSFRLARRGRAALPLFKPVPARSRLCAPRLSPWRKSCPVLPLNTVCSEKSSRGWGRPRMRHATDQRLEIIRLGEQHSLERLRALCCNSRAGRCARCLIPRIAGAIHSKEWKTAPWDMLGRAAPPKRTGDVRLAESVLST